MAPQSEKTCEEEDANNAPAAKTTRHPRWTRQETIILIEAKKVVENGGTTQVCRLSQSEPKWDMVSSLCQKQGVNRGPVQCRKRWSNLLSDFKKIKKWDSGIKEESESYWMMRNDERKEKKLPGFFDGELYNVLEGGVCAAATAFPLEMIKVTSSKAENIEKCDEDDVEEEEEAEAIVDSEKMGWSTEEEETIETISSRKKVNGPTLNESGAKETIMTWSPRKPPTHAMPNSGSGKRIEPMSQEGSKRRRVISDNCEEDTTSFNNPFMRALRRNSNILKTHLGDQNKNYQMARDQQKEQNGNLVAALGRLTDALIKIAEKL